MYVVKDDTIRISVRRLVEFICAQGSIDNRESSMSDVKLMQEGSRIHRKIQKSMGPLYKAEVPLKIEIPRVSDAGPTYTIVLEGRADGIMCDIDEDDEGNKNPISDVTIDEIKSMRADVKKMEEAVYVHKAQAKCYGYIYMRQHSLAYINIQMTYVNIDNEEVKTFSEQYTFEEMSEWFENLIDKFAMWTDFVFAERQKRNASIEKLGFPFEYRKGQKNLVVNVYKSIMNEKNLYIQAPTGVGKTISTVFPAVQAVGQGQIDKIFYLTSKTITRTVAENTYAILRDSGMTFRTVTLTAKDKICHQEERKCNPVDCPYADGHYDRINDAVYDMITHEYVINRDTIMEYSKKYMVCPFEMSLDSSYWCDGIICDYNYVFDPDVALKRYFGDGNKGDYVFLVDEAHNLVDRAREMYSAVLKKEDFLAVKKLVKDYDHKLSASLERCNKELLELKRQCDTYRVIMSADKFVMNLERCFANFQTFMEKHQEHPDMEDILNFYFEMRHFLNMYECVDEKYVIYTEHNKDGDFLIHLYCVDPSGNISERLMQGVSTIFFSATLLPVNYFKEMLSGNTDDYAVYAESSFDSELRRVLVSRDVSSRYTRRGPAEYKKICEYIIATYKAKAGKYMIFFPSYAFMEAVKQEFLGMVDAEEINLFDIGDISELPLFGETKSEAIDKNEAHINIETDEVSIISQSTSMNEKNKEHFLKCFEKSEVNGTLLGFCVTGGIFSEGIDLKEDSLIGAIIVGTGLPMICRERNILKEYYDDNGRDGYSYAYVYPGMNKVLQAAGRVIRTTEDCGVIELLDDRFMTREYEQLFPREWDMIYPATMSTVGGIVDEFWKNIGKS